MSRKKKVVIAGSASLQKKIQYWKDYWENRGYLVTDFPSPLSKENFLKEYPQIHKAFFKNIINSDVLFVANENKNGVKGYLGAESFAELCFGIVQNLIYHKKIKIILLQMPERTVPSYDEITLWLKLRWIKLHKKST